MSPSRLRLLRPSLSSITASRRRAIMEEGGVLSGWRRDLGAGEGETVKKRYRVGAHRGELGVDGRYRIEAASNRCRWRRSSPDEARASPGEARASARMRRGQESGFALLLVFLMAAVVGDLAVHGDSTAWRSRRSGEGAVAGRRAVSNTSAPSNCSSREGDGPLAGQDRRPGEHE